MNRTGRGALHNVKEHTKLPAVLIEVKLKWE
jgi:hypothetical protein